MGCGKKSHPLFSDNSDSVAALHALRLACHLPGSRCKPPPVLSPQLQTDDMTYPVPSMKKLIREADGMIHSADRNVQDGRVRVKKWIAAVGEGLQGDHRCVIYAIKLSKG